MKILLVSEDFNVEKINGIKSIIKDESKVIVVGKNDSVESILSTLELSEIDTILDCRDSVDTRKFYDPEPYYIEALPRFKDNNFVPRAKDLPKGHERGYKYHK